MPRNGQVYQSGKVVLVSEQCKMVNPRSCWTMKNEEALVDISTQRIRHDKI
jgi:CMP-N-acetylneuraminic acid synthetase